MPASLHRPRSGGVDLKTAPQPQAERVHRFVYLSEGFATTLLVVTGNA